MHVSNTCDCISLCPWAREAVEILIRHTCSCFSADRKAKGGGEDRPGTECSQQFTGLLYDHSNLWQLGRHVTMELLNSGWVKTFVATCESAPVATCYVKSQRLPFWP